MAVFTSTILKTETNLWSIYLFVAPKLLISYRIETAASHVGTQRDAMGKDKFNAYVSPPVS